MGSPPARKKVRKDTQPPHPERIFGAQARRIRANLDSGTNMGFFPPLDQIDRNPPPVPQRPVNKPTSQMAATAPLEPPAEKVAMLESLGMDTATAIRYLKAKRNDVDAAVNAFYDEEDISKDESSNSWDEGAFNADREGNPASLYPLGATAPPSRAPSRVGDRLHPTSREQEDADLQQALSMSQNVEPQAFQQEGGIINKDGSQTATFGPATKQHYDTNQWALVPSTAHGASEIVPDLELDAQKHVPGEPRILKHVPTGDYVSNLLSILHSIPAAREALLMRDHVLPNYGENDDWWKGHPITLPQIVHLDDHTPVEPTNKYEDFLAEIQRLMAFLDASDRSVMSPGGLTQTDAIKKGNPGTTVTGTVAELVLQKWIDGVCAQSDGQSAAEAIFTTKVASGGSHGTPVVQSAHIIDILTSVREGEKMDLPSLLDGLFWGKDLAEMREVENSVTQSPEILTLYLHRGYAVGDPLRVEIPAELCVDKYLAENAEAMTETRQQRARWLSRLEKIEEVQERLTKWRHPRTSESLDTFTLLTHTLSRYSGANVDEDGNVSIASGAGALVDDSDPSSLQPSEITKELERVIESIKEKLVILEAEKEKTYKALAAASQTPIGLPPSASQHRYTLRGVATKPNITYMLLPQTPPATNTLSSDGDAEMAISPTEDDSTPPGMQWWRIEYDSYTSTSGSAQITRTKAADYDVLRAAELEHSSCLLVYARSRPGEDVSPSSAHWPYASALPRALQEFIDRDNALFRDALDSAPPPAYGYGTHHESRGVGPGAAGTTVEMADIEAQRPRPSIERNSFDSTRGEGGSEHDFSSGEVFSGARKGGLEVGSSQAYGSQMDISRASTPLEVPPYEDERFMAHGGFGLGPQIQGEKWAVQTGEVEEGEVKEIRLDGEGEVEMSEKQ